MKTERTVKYTNPVGGITNIGDPFVLKDKDTYYMYATSAATIGFRAWQSSNLVDWEDKGLVFDSYEQPNQWATGDFWAPEVVMHNGEFFMTYSARNADGHLQISIAKSKDPLGPFKDVSTEIVQQEGSYIDGHIFFEEDGTPYFYYVKDNYENIINGKHVSQIFVQKMTEDLTELTGEPKLLLEPDQDWEGLGGEYQWNEGPFVIKNDHKYYLMYSANFYASSDYGVGYAVSDSPMGPFKKSDENPILSKDLENGISGPGHNSVTVGLDGKTLYTVYHTHTDPEAPSGDRQMNIDRLYFDGGKLKIDGPSHSEREISLGGNK
ncbi:glycoside hydrolase family 43 protein [Mesobacillus stamsii]|uniref:Beta-xylosidase n=1 Tax=Mesobacillus stamsii TaxID=225347 RepID=A0ABU0FYS9_9BACI|nr:glycoside hydrolase family 43 protein [Mesobacillus stamsii]MDQ0415078.1 beta-xylosidase [Mesobacillus stamsii]